MPAEATDIRLTPTSYIVLGFLSLLGEATPYDLKRMVSISVGHFWSFPHSQLYAEPDRLAGAGYVAVHQEDTGRRRKLYTLTERGSAALASWRADPATESFELRDPATLKLFFGTDPVELAGAEVVTLREGLAELEATREQNGDAMGEGPRLALEYGIHMVRASIDYWSEIARRA